MAQRRRKHHNHNKTKNMKRQYVQFAHSTDEDDLLEEKELRSVEQNNREFKGKELQFVQFAHEDDADDILLDQQSTQRGSARARMEEDARMERFFKSNGEVSPDEALIQLNAEDRLLPRKKGEPFLYESELVQSKEEQALQAQSDEVQAIMDQQARDEAMVQLDYAHIPHADDTEDIVEDDITKSYDHHHSKEWNELVDRRAEELDNEMKIEENMKVAKKKAAEEAKRKAIEQKAKQEAEKKQQAQALAEKKAHKQKQTVDFSDIYEGVKPEDLMDVQLGYQNHSKFWNQQVAEQTVALEKTIKDEEEREGLSKAPYGTTDGVVEQKFKTA